MTTISAETILRSRNAAAPEKVLSTLLLRYPRWIHAEGRTHRLLDVGEDFGVEVYTPALMDCDDLSRNAGSSRALPVSKMIADIRRDPAMPIYWGSNQKGMQATGETNASVLDIFNKTPGAHPGYISREKAWLKGMEQAIALAEAYAEAGYHKQIVNRLLEPFSHITVVVSATEWSNFLALRDHADAEPHIAMLAREIRQCLDDESTIQTLRPGEWHLPFVFASDGDRATTWWRNTGTGDYCDFKTGHMELCRKLSVARCASTSFKTVDGFDMTLERAIALHDKLVGSAPLHASPCEHVAQADGYGGLAGFNHWYHREQHGNFVGFRQYRKMLPGECL